MTWFVNDKECAVGVIDKEYLVLARKDGQEHVQRDSSYMHSKTVTIDQTMVDNNFGLNPNYYKVEKRDSDGVNTIIAERKSRYGDFTEEARISDGICALMEASPEWQKTDPIARQMLRMLAVKMARITNGDETYVDNYDDIMGYAKIAKERLCKPTSTE